MAKLPPYSKLPDEPCLTEAQLFAYLDEQLSPAEQHEAEAHLLDCAMCSDALEGLAMLQDRKAIHAVLPLAAASPITETTLEEDDSKKVIPLFRRPVVLASAAVVALLLGVTVLLKIGIGEAEKQQVADVVQEEKKSQAPAPRADSIAANTMQEPHQVGPDIAKNIAPEIKVSEVNEQEVSSYAAADEVAAPIASAIEPVAPVAKEENDNEALREAAKDRDAEKQQNASAESNESKKQNTTTASKPRNRSKTTKAKSRSFDAPASNAGASRSEEKLDDAVGNKYDQDYKQSLDSTPGNQRPHPLKASDRDLDLSYTNGVNLLAAGQAQASIAFFDEVIKNPAHPHYDDALWQKSQALLKLNKKVEAKPVLELLVKRNSKYKAQAEEALKKY
jgi:anti-sigma factor RsiW